MTLRKVSWRARPKTRIVCTIGPASQSEPQLQALLQAGANVIRLNFSHGTREENPEGGLPSEAEAVARAACEIASILKVEVIAAITLEGTTARLVDKYRPSQPILAITSRVETYRRLALIRGVMPLLLPADIVTREAIIEKAKEIMRICGLQGKRIVIVFSISTEQNLLATDIL